MQEIQTLCVPREIEKVRNFWEANLNRSGGPTRSKSTDSALGKKKDPPQLYPKPQIKKVIINLEFSSVVYQY